MSALKNNQFFFLERAFFVVVVLEKLSVQIVQQILEPFFIWDLMGKIIFLLKISSVFHFYYIEVILDREYIESNFRGHSF